MISVVIPSFNRHDLILSLLEDLAAQQGVDHEVIVVDDCSTDNTPQAVRSRFPNVGLLVNETNGGPCVTRNRGVMAARGDLIVGFDSDVAVRDHHLLAKIQCAFTAHPEAAGIAFRILRTDGSDDLQRWWHPVSCRNGCDRPFETHYFSGTAYAFRRSTMIGAGLFPTVFYMHYEEVELALRILENGGRILYLPHLAVIHHAAPTQRRNRIQTFFKPRNQILLAIRCLPFRRALRYLLPRLIYNANRAIIGRHMRAFLSALCSSFKLAPACFHERNPVKSATWKRINAMRRQLS